MAVPLEIWIRQKPQGMWMLYQLTRSREVADSILESRRKLDVQHDYEVRECSADVETPEMEDTALDHQRD